MEKAYDNKEKVLKKSIIFGVYLFLICFCLANLEIQIEGPDGWAAKLPTWKNTNPNITWVFGGRPITGYHLFLNLLLLTFYHFPLLFTRFSLEKEIKIIYSFSIIAVIWDFQWFVMNPYYGMQKYKPENIWWFKNWLFGFPRDYFIGIFISFLIFLIPAFLKRSRISARIKEWLIITSTLLLCTIILVMLYRFIH